MDRSGGSFLRRGRGAGPRAPAPTVRPTGRARRSVPDHDTTQGENGRIFCRTGFRIKARSYPTRSRTEMSAAQVSICIDRCILRLVFCIQSCKIFRDILTISDRSFQDLPFVNRILLTDFTEIFLQFLCLIFYIFKYLPADDKSFYLHNDFDNFHLRSVIHILHRVFNT